MTLSLRPFDLAARQEELDRISTRRFPSLHLRKRARLLLSPHGFLRGSAPLFYEILLARPELGEGPEGEGWLVGDMHMENVGAYRNEADEVVFDLNDFDDGAVGPWRLDVLRLGTSVLLASRTFRSTGPDALRVLGALHDAYVRASCASIAVEPPRAPAPVVRLMETVSRRSRHELLDERAPEHHGKRHFLRGERYLDLPEDTLNAIPEILKAYIHGLAERAPTHAGDWQIEDAAQRIAGTGSLGSLRIAVLLRNRSGDERLLDLKEARPSAVNLFIPAQGDNTRNPADRVVQAAISLLKSPPAYLGPIPETPLGLPMIGRRLRPQEDKLDLESLTSRDEIEAVARTIGHVLGCAHRKGAHTTSKSPWSDKDLSRLVDHTVELAGLFEAIYLAYARLTF